MHMYLFLLGWYNCVWELLTYNWSFLCLQLDLFNLELQCLVTMGESASKHQARSSTVRKNPPNVPLVQIHSGNNSNTPHFAQYLVEIVSQRRYRTLFAVFHTVLRKYS